MKKYERQIVQSIGQFLVVLLAELLVFSSVPTSFDQLWQPLLRAAVAALGIWGFSKVGPAPRK